MADRAKTKDELIAELEALRRRVGALERSAARHQFFGDALRKSEARFRTLMETIPHGIEECNTEGVITFANGAHHRLHGYADGKLLGKYVWELIASESDRDFLRQHFQHLVETQPPPTPIAAVNRTKDGRLFDVQVDWDYQRDADGKLTGFISVITDVTQRKQIENELRRARDELEHRVKQRTAELEEANEELNKEIAERIQIEQAVLAQRKKAERAIREEQERLRRSLEMHERDRQLVAYEIHDGFVQPLVGARMMLDMPVDDLEPKQQERHRQGIELLQRTIAEARRLISGRRPLILDEGGLLDAIEHLVFEQATAEGPPIEFSHDVRFGRLAQPLETAIFRVVQEGLSNAQRYSQSPKVRIRMKHHDQTVSVEIEDFGVGFDLYSVSGNCFGLEGLRERARMFGGEAAITSVPGQGTLIYVEFPIVEAPSAAD